MASQTDPDPYFAILLDKLNRIEANTAHSKPVIVDESAIEAAIRIIDKATLEIAARAHDAPQDAIPLLSRIRNALRGS
jgi:Holliday junction resolvasome RuvABC ATP-dependent DNA helicase subunit